ncbi:GNAT family N-acetyltransferase [Micromonospora sp. KC721]|uniref:GNAT family N-acetyltransferase n=1 Tax=Micromonospora sp. KC721 TaxID=2530380 RepID=UPI00104635D8|nr:GNAT family N-acetyltransferase [Micromonospora sp. KC721]TDB77356.1 GNAT family N-acetyltransferase [Micromonospora sp. KC721]
MVHELADYQHAADQCRLTAEQLTEALFGPSPALFGHVAVDADDEPVGFALWFLTFSTWVGGHGIHLEDLYVRPPFRGTGAGRLLLATLAATCVQRGFGRLEWSMVDWNPAARFYASVRAVPVEGLVPYRLSGPALHALAAQAEAAPAPGNAREGRVPDQGDEA